MFNNVPFLNYAIYVFIMEPYNNKPFILCLSIKPRSIPHVLPHSVKEHVMDV